MLLVWIPNAILIRWEFTLKWPKFLAAKRKLYAPHGLGASTEFIPVRGPAGLGVKWDAPQLGASSTVC
jgi:hypothetical protein